MNVAFIVYLFGLIIIIEAASMLLPALVGLIYSEASGWSYLTFAIVFMVAGFLMIIKKPAKNRLFAKEGFALVALSWIIMSLIGALPLYFSGDIPNFTDALFEIVSGFTTTGATILTDVEAVSHAGHFWRCFSHWLGGMGVFVFLLSVMPLTGGNNIHLMKAESPGPAVGKLVPKLRDTAKILYLIYFVMTVILFVLLLIAGMPVFDSICTALGTAGTGGFGIKSDSIASYNDACKWIIATGMILFGVNFNFYFALLGKNKKEIFKMEEVRWYFLIILASTGLIAVNVLDVYGGNAYVAVREAYFQVGTYITSTGFATTNVDLWPMLSKNIIILIILMGACAGSTGGGIKVVRVLAVLKALKREIENLIHPRLVKTIKIDGKPVESDYIRGVFVFFGAYATLFIISNLLLSLDQYDFLTNFTASAATLSNTGLGLAGVGPTGNYQGFSVLSKYVLMFNMLAGRLEIFPMLVLLSPLFSKRR